MVEAKIKCAFCGFDLTDDDLNAQSPMAYWPHCKDHVNHASYPQLWLLKKELNIAYEEPKREHRICGVCGTYLSDDEMNLVEKTHVNFVCHFHKRAKMDHNIFLTRRNLGYSEFLRRPIDQMIDVWKL